MAYSLLVIGVPKTSENVSESVEMLSDFSETDQMNLLAQHFDKTGLNSSANVRMSDTETESGRLPVNSSESMSSSVSGEISNKYLSLHLPIQHEEQMTKLAGHHKNLDEASSQNYACVYCREKKMRKRL